MTSTIEEIEAIDNRVLSGLVAHTRPVWFFIEWLAKFSSFKRKHSRLACSIEKPTMQVSMAMVFSIQPQLSQ